MGLFDTVIVEVLSADFQTKQLGESMLHYRLTEDGWLVASRGLLIAYPGLVHLLGEVGADLINIFTYSRLETLKPVIGKASNAYRGLGQGSLWTRDPW